MISIQIFHNNTWEWSYVNLFNYLNSAEVHNMVCALTAFILVI